MQTSACLLEHVFIAFQISKGNCSLLFGPVILRKKAKWSSSVRLRRARCKLVRPKYVLMVRKDHSGYCWLFAYFDILAESGSSSTGQQRLVSRRRLCPTGLLISETRPGTLFGKVSACSIASHLRPTRGWAVWSSTRAKSFFALNVLQFQSSSSAFKSGWLFCKSFEVPSTISRLHSVEKLCPLRPFILQSQHRSSLCTFDHTHSQSWQLSICNLKSWWTLMISVYARENFVWSFRSHWKTIPSQVVQWFPGIATEFWGSRIRACCSIWLFRGRKNCTSLLGTEAHIVKKVLDYLFRVEELQSREQEKVHISLLKFYRNKYLNETAIIPHVKCSATGMTVTRLMWLQEEDEGLKVVVIWKGLPHSEDTAESLCNLYEEVPQMLLCLPKRKNIPKCIPNQANCELQLWREECDQFQDVPCVHLKKWMVECNENISARFTSCAGLLLATRQAGTSLL